MLNKIDHVQLVREANRLVFRLADDLLLPDDTDHMVRLQIVIERAVGRMLRRTNAMLNPVNNPMLGN